MPTSPLEKILALVPMHVWITWAGVFVSLALLFCLFVNILVGWTREMRKLAERRGWTLPGSLDRGDARAEIEYSGVVVHLHLKKYFSVARAQYEGERVFLRRLTRGERFGAYPGLTYTATGDDAFESSCELFTSSGMPPAWLTPELRSGFASIEAPVTLTAGEGGLGVEVWKGGRSPLVLERLVDLAMATRSPDFARAAASRLAAPIRVRRSWETRAFLLALFALPLTLVVSCVGLSPTELAAPRFEPSGAPLEATLDVRAGDTIEIWQDVRFERDRSFAGLSLEIEAAMDSVEPRLLRCNAHAMSPCVRKSKSSGGTNCYLEGCQLYAERNGKLRVRVWRVYKDPENPYAIEHRIRFERRHRWLP